MQRDPSTFPQYNEQRKGSKMYHNSHKKWRFALICTLSEKRYRCSGSALVRSIYLSCLLLEGHEVQIGDVHHVGAAHHRQHPVLHLACQRADVQELSQLGLLGEGDENKTGMENKRKPQIRGTINGSSIFL